LIHQKTNPIENPVIIIAGGCDHIVQMAINDYRQLFFDVFKDYSGTIISGGTPAGISGLVGEIGMRCHDRITTIGYVPGKSASTIDIDVRYKEIRKTNGKEFSVLEPLQYWADIISSDLEPNDIKLLGVNGGAIAIAECRLALTLGATVGIIKNSGRAADKILADNKWTQFENLTGLTSDPTAISVFINQPPSPRTSQLRDQ